MFSFYAFLAAIGGTPEGIFLLSYHFNVLSRTQIGHQFNIYWLLILVSVLKWSLYFVIAVDESERFFFHSPHTNGTPTFFEFLRFTLFFPPKQFLIVSHFYIVVSSIAIVIHDRSFVQIARTSYCTHIVVTLFSALLCYISCDTQMNVFIQCCFKMKRQHHQNRRLIFNSYWARVRQHQIKKANDGDDDEDADDIEDYLFIYLDTINKTFWVELPKYIQKKEKAEGRSEWENTRISFKMFKVHTYAMISRRSENKKTIVH